MSYAEKIEKKIQKINCVKIIDRTSFRIHKIFVKPCFPDPLIGFEKNDKELFEN